MAREWISYTAALWRLLLHAGENEVNVFAIGHVAW